MAVPVVLITAQLLVLCLLLLFLAVTNAVEARGPEIALAKLRGGEHGRRLRSGCLEPVTLLALALPAGILAGWGATAAICHGLLRPGTPVVLPGLAWATAAAATAGGLAAAVLAAPADTAPARPGGVAAFRPRGKPRLGGGCRPGHRCGRGPLDLAVTGRISSARPGTLILLVPGLLGLAVAVIASRLLPLGCRAAFARTGRGGGLGLFLALRHVTRRPGGARTTIVLATAFALAAFAVSAWSVGRDNQQHVAAIEVGAPTVLTVSVPAGKDLSTIVARADPGGRMAAAVDSYTSLSSGSAGLTTLAVDPGRFAHVAAWLPGPRGQSLAALAPKLDPPRPSRSSSPGTLFRLTVQVHTLSPPGALLAADVTTGASPVSLGPLPAHGTATLTGQLVGCPCVLRDLDASPRPGTCGPR